MGIYTVNGSIKPTFTLFILKERSQFVLGFILYLNSFVSFKTIRYYKTCNLFSYIVIISYIPQIHQIALTIDMCQENGWEALLLQLLFRIF